MTRTQVLTRVQASIDAWTRNTDTDRAVTEENVETLALAIDDAITDCLDDVDDTDVANPSHLRRRES